MFNKVNNPNPVIGAKMTGQLLEDFKRVQKELKLDITQTLKYLVRLGIEAHDSPKIEGLGIEDDAEGIPVVYGEFRPDLIEAEE
jgi:hypothetical protein